MLCVASDAIAIEGLGAVKSTHVGGGDRAPRAIRAASRSACSVQPVPSDGLRPEGWPSRGTVIANPDCVSRIVVSSAGDGGESGRTERFLMRSS